MKFFGFLLLLGLYQMSNAIPNYYMDTNCGQTIMLDYYISQIRLYLTRNVHYNPNMQCTLVINSTLPEDKLMLFFRSMSIEDSSLCNRDWLDVKDGSNQNAPYVSGAGGRMCGFSYDSYVYHSTGKALFLNFHSDSSFQYSGFQMVITRYHTGICYSDEFSCSNGRCVEEVLTCNGNNPCGDHSDCPLTAGAIAGIAVGGFFFLLFVVVLTLVCRRRRRRRRGYIAQTVVSTDTYGTAGYNQPVPQQYPAYPTGQQYPASGQVPGGQQYPPSGQQPYPGGQQPYPGGQPNPQQPMKAYP